MEKGVFYTFAPGQEVVLCSNGEMMTLISSQRYGLVWQCPKRNCCNRSKKSIRQDSFFYGRKAPIEKVVGVLYCWYLGLSLSQVQMATNLNKRTISSLYQDIYKLIQMDLRENDIQIGKLIILFIKSNSTIGGVDEHNNPIIVEIDESKFGKRKYHHGHCVEGVWVVGDVERTREHK